MMEPVNPVVIKKYGNRRLYNTTTSTYENVESLAGMAKRGENFIVYDAKSGDDITRSVLRHIVSEEEKKSGQDLLPVAFMRRLIGFYGDAMQEMVPAYLERSMETLTRERDFTRPMRRGFWLKLSGRSRRSRMAIRANWRTGESISEWKDNQQQRHFSRKDRWFSHIRSAGT
jgi:polyhydroxyalkanoate synthesis repressor PhaR